MDFEEAAILWPKVGEFFQTHKRKPDINSLNDKEKRMAECIIFLRKQARQNEG